MQAEDILDRIVVGFVVIMVIVLVLALLAMFCLLGGWKFLVILAVALLLCFTIGSLVDAYFRS